MHHSWSSYDNFKKNLRVFFNAKMGEWKKMKTKPNVNINKNLWINELNHLSTKV